MNANKKNQYRDLNGVLIFDKPKLITSNKALQIVKKIFQAKKAGHTGSLDPLATGVLPICFGEATKFSSMLLETDKTYRVVAKLGARTDTYDLLGNVIATYSVPVLKDKFVEKILDKFRGEIEQIPPMYSAIKHQGKPLYKYARSGLEIKRLSRKVTIYSLDLIKKEKDELEFMVHCSKGTYIRTLIEDIGKALKCGAYVKELERVAVGSFKIKNAITLEDLRNIENKNNDFLYDKEKKDFKESIKIDVDISNDFHLLDYNLLPVEVMVQNLPSIKLEKQSAYYISLGNSIFVPNVSYKGRIALFEKDTNLFLGIGEILENGKIAPKRLLKNISQNFIL